MTDESQEIYDLNSQCALAEDFLWTGLDTWLPQVCEGDFL